jgi:uncharacterized membrane protein
MGEEELPGKGRIEALTDGIFAVAMTLLVLDLRLADGAQDLAERLASLGLKFENYVISFLVLCVFWLGHHRLMQVVRHVDASFLWLNLLFLLAITFVPFATSVLGEHPGSSGGALLYGANLAAILAVQSAMWRHAFHRLADTSSGDPLERWRGVRLRFGGAFAIVAVACLAALAGWRFAAYVYLAFFFLGVAATKVTERTWGRR